MKARTGPLPTPERTQGAVARTVALTALLLLFVITWFMVAGSGTAQGKALFEVPPQVGIQLDPNATP